jgi:hypothetical protein
MKHERFIYVIALNLCAAWLLAACQPAGQIPPLTSPEAEQPSGYPAAAPEPGQATPAYPGSEAPGNETPDPMEVFPTDSPGILPPPTIGEIPAEILETLHADARDRAGQPNAVITLIRAEAVQWPDGSLGCPQPDMMYTQAIVPGYWVVLELDGESFDYRVSERGGFVLCENGTPPIFLPSS